MAYDTRYSTACEHFSKYVRKMNPQTHEQIAHLYLYGCAILPEQTVVTLMDRTMNQPDLYAPRNPYGSR